MITFSAHEIREMYFSRNEKNPYQPNKKGLEWGVSRINEDYFSDVVILFYNGKHQGDVFLFIKPETLKLFNSSNWEKFRLCGFKLPWDNKKQEWTDKVKYLEIALEDEITEYEREHDCNTIEQVKTKIGKKNFNFKTPHNRRVAEKYLIDFVNLKGNLHKIFISKSTWNYINENPNVDTLKLEITENDYCNGKGMQYNIEILLWEEKSSSDEEYEDYRNERWASEAEAGEAQHQAMLDDLNGDWGGLHGDEADLARWNCD